MKTVEWGESYPSGNTEHRMQYGICLHLSDGTVLKVDDIASSPTICNTSSGDCRVSK